MTSHVVLKNLKTAASGFMTSESRLILHKEVILTHNSFLLITRFDPLGRR